MFDKLKNIKKRFEFLTGEIVKPEVISNQNEFKKLAKEHASLSELVETYDKWVKCDAGLKDTEELLHVEKDAEMLEMLEAEVQELKKVRAELEEELKVLLLPKDPNDDNNVIIEIRGGAGGEEASLFAAVLKRMYYRFAERQRLKIEEIDENATDLGGIKEVVFSLIGKGAYSKLKFESGVHRVQRVPETESQGRIHTSTVTVAVLPEVDDIEIQIEEKDLKVDTYRSSGAGGQHVNTTDSAIRITHLPTGLIVACQDERSQIKNRDKAMKTLKSKLYDFYQSKAEKEYAAERRTQVGTGDRSERIRTYNYPQGRVTDHRIGMTVYALAEYLDGDILDMIEALKVADRAAKLQGSSPPTGDRGSGN